MLNILDAGQGWLGRPARALRAGNRRPVALSDALSLLRDSPAATVVVLGNDFDPEGGALTVTSATAAQGAVSINPDNTLSYTPPAGYVGPDTIAYVVTDDQGQSHGAQVVITVSAPQLSINVQPDNTLVVTAETGTMDITVTDPPGLAGTYQADPADLAAGPVTLAPPAITGTPDPGQVLTATGGLWIHDTAAGAPAQGWQWRRAGVDIAAATGATYTVAPADAGQGLSVVETMTDANGARSAASLPVGSAFAPPADPQLLGWWDAADAATITASGGAVSAWADKAGGAPMTQAFAPQMPGTGLRTLNGLNVLDFDGGRLLESARAFPATGDVAFHMVLEIDSVSNLFEAVLALEATNDFQIDAGSSTQFDGRLNAAGIGAPTPLAGGPFAGAMILSAVFDRTGAGQAQVFIADTLRATMAYGAPIDASAALHLMTNRSKNAWIDGAVAEVVVTGDVANRAAYHAYLQTKWGNL